MFQKIFNNGVKAKHKNDFHQQRQSVSSALQSNGRVQVDQEEPIFRQESFRYTSGTDAVSSTDNNLSLLAPSDITVSENCQNFRNLSKDERQIELEKVFKELEA